MKTGPALAIEVEGVLEKAAERAAFACACCNKFAMLARLLMLKPPEAKAAAAFENTLLPPKGSPPAEDVAGEEDPLVELAFDVIVLAVLVLVEEAAVAAAAFAAVCELAALTDAKVAAKVAGFKFPRPFNKPDCAR